MNSRIHIEDSDFALEDGLLPRNVSRGNIREQFFKLAELAELKESQESAIFTLLLSNQDRVNTLIQASFLNEKTKRNYLQAYQTRIKKISA